MNSLTLMFESVTEESNVKLRILEKTNLGKMLSSHPKGLTLTLISWSPVKYHNLVGLEPF